MTMRRDKLIAALVVLAGLLLAAYALLSPTSDVHTSMMGVPVTSSSYSLAHMLLAIVGSFMAASGAAFVLFKEDYEPLADSASTQIAGDRHERAKVSEPPAEGQTAVAAQEPAPEGLECVPVDEGRLVLRLLTGDERAMFRAIVESGGEALQKDLIVKTKMSDAKVSRVLDRLVEKGVISKTRHGVTNKVKVEIEP